MKDKWAKVGEKRFSERSNEEKGQEIRQHRDLDFKLNKVDLDTLLKDKLIWFPSERFSKGKIGSYAHFYLRAFENDMPVYITVDSILHAFHQSISGILDKLELGKLGDILLLMLEKAIIEIPKITEKYINENDFHTANLLRETEVFYNVAYKLLTYKIPAPEEMKKYEEGYEDGYEEAELSQDDVNLDEGEKNIDINHSEGKSEVLKPEEENSEENPEEKSETSHSKTHNMENEDPDIIREFEQLRESQSGKEQIIRRFWHSLGASKREISKLRSKNDSEVERLADDFIKLIDSEENSDFTLFKTPKILDFSLFKPRGRYCDFQPQRNYFRCLIWLSNIEFNYKKEIQYIWVLVKSFYECFPKTTEDPLKIFKEAFYLIGGESARCDFKDIFDIAKNLKLDSYLLTENQKVSFVNAIIERNKETINFDFISSPGKFKLLSFLIFLNR